jgi:Domain of unknown function (DUF4328)
VYVLLGANIALAAVAFVAGMDLHSFYERAKSRPWTLTLAQLRHEQARADTINAIAVALMVATAIAFAIWTWLAYSRVAAQGYEHRFARGWAAGGWFVPFVNLYRPKQIIDEIVDAGRSTGEVVVVRRWTTAWWAAWIVTLVGGWIVSVMETSATKVDDAMGAVTAVMVRDVMLALTAVLAVVSVHHITRQLRALDARR